MGLLSFTHFVQNIFRSDKHLTIYVLDVSLCKLYNNGIQF